MVDENVSERNDECPWVVGIYYSRNTVRFIRVPDRKGATRLELILNNVQEDSLVVMGVERIQSIR